MQQRLGTDEPEKPGLPIPEIGLDTRPRLDAQGAQRPVQLRGVHHMSDQADVGAKGVPAPTDDGLQQALVAKRILAVVTSYDQNGFYLASPLPIILLTAEKILTPTPTPKIQQIPESPVILNQ